MHLSTATGECLSVDRKNERKKGRKEDVWKQGRKVRRTTKEKNERKKYKKAERKRREVSM
jgi:hypothetical protein